MAVPAAEDEVEEAPTPSRVPGSPERWTEPNRDWRRRETTVLSHISTLSHKLTTIVKIAHSGHSPGFLLLFIFLSPTPNVSPSLPLSSPGLRQKTIVCGDDLTGRMSIHLHIFCKGVHSATSCNGIKVQITSPPLSLFRSWSLGQ